MATNLVDRAWMNVSGTPGTGDITLGTVVDGNQSFSDAGVADGVPYSYVAIDGNDFEIGTGQAASSVTVWQRTTVSRSVISGTAGTTKLTLSGSAQIFLTARAVDLADASLFKTGTVAAARLPAASTSAQGAVQLATSSDEGTGTNATKAVTPSVQQYHPSAAKAWVNFNGTGTVAINKSFNVSSVTDNGVGKYTLNFTNTMADANYMVTGTGANSGNHGIHAMESNNGSAYTDKTTSEVQLTFTAENTGGVLDCFSINVVIFD